MYIYIIIYIPNYIYTYLYIYIKSPNTFNPENPKDSV